MEYNISADELVTKERIGKLRCYMDTEIFNDGTFLCSCYNDCKSSHNSLLYKGLLRHLGKKYDLTINGKSIRIMVVGQEFGHRENFLTLNENYDEKTVCGKIRQYNQRNNHMKGITDVLRLLFRKYLGTDSDSEYLTFSNGKSCHLFDTFFLVNYLLCSALKKDKGRSGNSISVMKTNCQQHFRKVLEILEPNIIIVQDKSLWRPVVKSFENIKYLSWRYPVGQAVINGKTVLIALFLHPSARNGLNWGANAYFGYKFNIVNPTISLIQKNIGLPYRKYSDIDYSTSDAQTSDKYPFALFYALI